MVIANTKIVQAYVQALVEVVKLVKQADIKAQAFKTKFVNKNPDLSGTNLTSTQITAVNNFITDLNDLASTAVATTIENRNQPSHSTGALD